jgi:polar amino acid transport system permease protein
MISRLKDRDALVLVGSVLSLGLVLWLMSAPLAQLPSPIGPAAQQFSEGARVTIQLTLVSAFFGLVLGVLAALGKLSHLPPLRWIADLFVWVIRGTPLLLQILFFYLALPAVIPGVQLSEFWTAVVALSLNVGAYNAEVIRAGINAVPSGQIEAARSLGLSKFNTFRDITLPQAVRISLPPLANNLVALLKDSSLAYAIGVVELSMVSSRVQAESFQPVPVFMTVAVVYLVLTTTFTQFAGALERKLAVGKR